MWFEEELIFRHINTRIDSEVSVMSKQGYNRSILEVSVHIDRQKKREFEKAISKELPGRDIARNAKTPGVSTKGLCVDRSELSLGLEQDLLDRELELRNFKAQTMNAINSPLLTQALVKNTADRLEQVEREQEEREEREQQQRDQEAKDQEREREERESRQGEIEKLHESTRRLTVATKQRSANYEKFRRSAKLVSILSSLCHRWRRYDPLLMKQLGGDQNSGNKSPSRKGKRADKDMGFDTSSFHTYRSKVPEDVIDSMQAVPRRRCDEDIKKIQAYSRKVRAFQMFPVEKEQSLAGWVGYARYDRGRVICMQGRRCDRWYFVLSGRVSKVQTMELTAGVRKQFFADLIQGNCTDVDEVIQADDREYSLLCHSIVEVLLLEREDIEEIFASTTGQGTSILSFLKGIDLFSTYPLDELFAERDALTIKYFAKDTVIGDSDTDSNYLCVLKSGSGTLLVKPNTDSKQRERELEYTSEGVNTSTDEQAPPPTRGALQSTPGTAPDAGVEDAQLHSSVFDKCDMYGFDTVLSRALKKVQNGIGANYFTDVVLPDRAHSRLISDGAECVLISKIAFLKIADFCTLCKLITTHLHKEPLQNRASRETENSAVWSKFKEDTVREVVERKQSTQMTAKIDADTGTRWNTK